MIHVRNKFYDAKKVKWFFYCEIVFFVNSSKLKLYERKQNSRCCICLDGLDWAWMRKDQRNSVKVKFNFS